MIFWNIVLPKGWARLSEAFALRWRLKDANAHADILANSENLVIFICGNMKCFASKMRISNENKN